MARLGCECGAEMTNTIAPSKNIINIYTFDEVQKAIEDNPDILLWDFYSGWDEIGKCNNSFQYRKEPVEYWYCTSCKMVFEVQAISCGKVLRKYAFHNSDNYIVTDDINELIILKDVEMDRILNLKPDMLLKEFIDDKRTEKYFISQDESTVYVYEGETNTAIYTLNI